MRRTGSTLCPALGPVRPRSRRAAGLALGSALLCSVLWGAGCAGSQGARGSQAAVMPVAELPERQRAVLEAYGAGGAAWEEMRAVVRADPDLARFTIENLVIEQVRAHDALISNDRARARAALDRARAELVRLAPESVPVLVELFALGDDVVSRQVGETLAQIQGPADGAAARVAELLADSDPGVRRRAARLMGDLGSAGPGEIRVLGLLSSASLSDRDWSVRAEAARSLGLRAGRGRSTRAARGTLERALADGDRAVATCAAEGLGALEDPMAVPALIGALERAVGEGDLKLLRAAQGALLRATGERSERDLGAWRHWWSQHGGQIRARAGASPR